MILNLRKQKIISTQSTMLMNLTKNYSQAKQLILINPDL